MPEQNQKGGTTGGKPITDEVRNLARDLMELDDLLISCMRCGFCMAVCPVFGATGKEADVTRGKIFLLENLAYQITGDAKAVNEKLNRCLLCGSCQANCPSGVKIMDIFLKARAIITGYLGLSPVKKMVFRGLLVRPKLFNALLDLAGKFQGFFLRKANAVVGTSCAPILNPFIGARHFPKLAAEAFHSQQPSLNTNAGSSGLRVAFFPGCVSDKIFPSVARASLKVLEKEGVGVFMPASQSCCGIPALASGDRQDFDVLTRQNLGCFAGGEFDYFVTPCATCAATIKELWPKLMDQYTEAEKKQITELAARTMDITAFLVDVLKVKLPAPSKGGQVVTYHDSCHLIKSLGVSAQPRAILASLPGYDFKEMPEADRCCGSGGSFTLFHYDLSREIGQRKRDNIVSVKPDTVAVGCPACMMQIMDMLSRNKDSISVKHVVELYAETL